MTGGDSSPILAPPPKARKEPSTTATTTLSLRASLPPAAITGSGHGVSPIHKLSDDLLLEVFLRLPSLATLVRAAFTCRAWRCAVASSPEFRRRFRAIHPVPLLGLFFDAPGPARDYNAPAFPTFVPSRRRDRDLTAAVRGGDFFLTCIEDLPDEAPSWEMADCCHGCVLLMNWELSSLVVFNPLARQSENVFHVDYDDIFDDHRGRYGQALPRLLISAEDPMSFRVVLLANDRIHDKCRVRAVVFSSDTWEWSVQPWVDVPASSVDDEWIQDACGEQANGHMYWVYKDQRYLISLDTTTMQFCVSVLPHYLRYRSFDVGETKDGTTCIAFSDNLNVGVLMATRDNDGVERWALDKIVPMDRELERALQVGLDDGSVIDNPSNLSVFAVRHGYLYLATMTDDPQAPSWLLSLCLETMSLERLFRNMFDDDAHPYIMAWPSFLVGNYGSFAVEDAPSPDINH